EELVEYFFLDSQANDLLLEAAACFLEIDGTDGLAVALGGNQRKDLLDPRHALATKQRVEPAAGVELAKLSERCVGEVPAAIRRAVERRIVQADQLTVFRSPHVKLEANAQRQTGPKAGERAFGRRVHQPAVADDEGAGGLGSLSGQTQ